MPAALPWFAAAPLMALAGMLAGGVWIGAVGAMRQLRGVNETISSLLMSYIAIALFKHLVEGPLRDPASLNKPSTPPVPDALAIGSLPGLDVHWGLLWGALACIAAWVFVRHSTKGFAMRVAGGNNHAAKLVGLPVNRLAIAACAMGGAAAGLAGMFEVAAVQGSANASLLAGYGYAGILVAFAARQNPLAIVLCAVLVGGIEASGSLLQRRLGLPDATTLVLQGLLFANLLAWEAMGGASRHGASACRRSRPRVQPQDWRARMFDAHSPVAVLLLSLFAGAIRVSTPYLFVSIGECLTEKGGRVNLGLEGILVSGAMTGYAAAYLSGSPWLGVLAAGCAGLLLGCLHGLVCSLPRVSDIAFGIALMLAGTGLAFYLGKPFIEPQAPMLPSIDLGAWASSPQLHNALHVNPLFIAGCCWLSHCNGACVIRAGVWRCVSSARTRKAPARWVIRSRACAFSRRPPAASSRVSAARICRWCIRAAGTKACRADKA